MAIFDDQALVAAARAEQARMLDALTRLQPGGSVRIDREQFRRLALLVDRLAARGTETDDDGHQPIDGFRWWVPLPELERARIAQADPSQVDHAMSEFEPMMVRSLY